MYRSEDRSTLRDQLVRAARADARLTAAAEVGSAASGTADAWSDIDLAFRLAPGEQPLAVAQVWTTAMYAEHDATDHLDVWAGAALYRVFLLRNSLQVDLSFWPDPEFTATAAAFRLLFGETNPPRPRPAPDPHALVGYGWLYALHARSSIARGRGWQAAHMLDNVRERVIALACLRHGLPAHEGRGVDRLPPGLLDALAGTVPHSVRAAELVRVFEVLVPLLLAEAALVDPDLAGRITEPVTELLASSRPGHTGGAAP